IGFGEMGIGNTSSASLIISSLCDLPLSECVGKGTGATGGLFEQKLRTLQEVQQFHNLPAGTAPDRILATFGGFEIAEMVGGMLAAASKRCLVLVDGFISSAAFMIAKALHPLVQDYAIFTHQSEERGHLKALSYLGATPLLQLEMRLGEGTGCATAFPLLQMSVAVMNEMASFGDAGVSEETAR
ncbi:MAG: nicotinate-nucleotide--dimethylbenzimidazole phosphoribosyltransferase, partial [Bacteroidota bacterium]